MKEIDIDRAGKTTIDGLRNSPSNPKPTLDRAVEAPPLATSEECRAVQDELIRRERVDYLERLVGWHAKRPSYETSSCITSVPLKTRAFLWSIFHARVPARLVRSRLPRRHKSPRASEEHPVVGLLLPLHGTFPVWANS
jgi:hypothetical protein